MSFVALIPLLVSAGGLALYLLASKAEAKEVGRLGFACGLLVFLFLLPPELRTWRR
jgi:hypothetical protein